MSSPLSAQLATTAAACFGYFVVALLAMHFIRPDYTIFDHMISDYAVGRFGWIMTSAFIAASAGCLTLSIGMFLDGPASWLGRAGMLLMLVAAAGLIVTAIFPTDLETAPSTRSGDIHAISFLLNVTSLLVSTLLLAVSYGGDDRWRIHRLSAFAFVTILFAAFIAQYFTLHRGAPYGVTNRLFVAVLMAWLISNAVWLRHAAQRRVRSNG